MTGHPAGSVVPPGPRYRPYHWTVACCARPVQFRAARLAVAVCPGCTCAGLNARPVIMNTPAHLAAGPAAGWAAAAAAPLGGAAVATTSMLAATEPDAKSRGPVASAA